MITQIEEAVVNRIKAKLSSAAGFVAVQRGIEGIPQPAIYVSAEEGKFEKVTQSTFKQDLTLYVDIIFEHYSNEGERRKGIYLILEGIVQTILLQKLGLDISPLIPKSFRNTTDEDLKGKGLIAYTLEIETSYYIKKVEDEAVTDLLKVGLEYYLKPGDAVKDANELVSLGV